MDDEERALRKYYEERVLYRELSDEEWLLIQLDICREYREKLDEYNLDDTPDAAEIMTWLTAE